MVDPQKNRPKISGNLWRVVAFMLLQEARPEKHGESWSWQYEDKLAGDPGQLRQDMRAGVHAIQALRHEAERQGKMADRYGAMLVQLCGALGLTFAAGENTAEDSVRVATEKIEMLMESHDGIGTLRSIVLAEVNNLRERNERLQRELKVAQGAEQEGWDKVRRIQEIIKG